MSLRDLEQVLQGFIVDHNNGIRIPSSYTSLVACLDLVQKLRASSSDRKGRCNLPAPAVGVEYDIGGVEWYDLWWADSNLACRLSQRSIVIHSYPPPRDDLFRETTTTLENNADNRDVTVEYLKEYLHNSIVSV